MPYTNELFATLEIGNLRYKKSEGRRIESIYD